MQLFHFPFFDSANVATKGLACRFRSGGNGVSSTNKIGVKQETDFSLELLTLHNRGP